MPVSRCRERGEPMQRLLGELSTRLEYQFCHSTTLPNRPVGFEVENHSPYSSSRYRRLAIKMGHILTPKHFQSKRVWHAATRETHDSRLTRLVIVSQPVISQTRVLGIGRPAISFRPSGLALVSD